MWLTKRSRNSHYCSDLGFVQAVAVPVYFANCPATTVNGKEEEKIAEGEETETEEEEDGLSLQRELVFWLVAGGPHWSLLDSTEPGSDAWMSVRKFGGTFHALRHDVTVWNLVAHQFPPQLNSVIAPTSQFISLAYFSESVSPQSKKVHSSSCFCSDIS